jgi:hypothetical protein
MYVHTRQAPLNSHADRAMQLNTNFLVLSQLQKHIPAHHKQVPCESQKTNATGPFRFRRAQLNGDLSLGASITLLMVLASSTCGDRIHVIATLCRPLPHQDWGRAGSAGNRFARDDKELGAQLGGNQLPGERPRETSETWRSSPKPSQYVLSKGAATLNGAETQTSCAISAYAQPSAQPECSPMPLVSFEKNTPCMPSAFLRRCADRRLSSEHSGWAEGCPKALMAHAVCVSEPLSGAAPFLYHLWATSSCISGIE